MLTVMLAPALIKLWVTKTMIMQKVHTTKVRQGGPTPTMD